MPASTRAVQGSSATIGHNRHVCSIAEQELDNTSGALIHRAHEWGPAVGATLIDVDRASREQGYDALGGSLM